MVKGITRRVIVVKTPDPRYFEEAIFIVKENVSVDGTGAEEVLQEAQTAANRYVKNQVYRRRFFSRIPAPLYLVAGALLAAGAMLLTGLLV